MTGKKENEGEGGGKNIMKLNLGTARYSIIT